LKKHFTIGVNGTAFAQLVLDFLDFYEQELAS